MQLFNIIIHHTLLLLTPLTKPNLSFPLYKYSLNFIFITITSPQYQIFSTPLDKIMNSLLSKQQYYGYSKMEIEDPEEVKHRKAQFLIYKALKKSDSVRKQAWLKVRVCKLKIKIGRRLKRIRKTILLTFCVTRGGLYKQFMSQLKSWKGLLKGRENMVSTTLPPMFT